MFGDLLLQVKCCNQKSTDKYRLLQNLRSECFRGPPVVWHGRSDMEAQHADGFAKGSKNQYRHAFVSLEWFLVPK